MSSFQDLELCPPILNAINEEGYHTPTPIQAKAIPPILSGRDVLGCAQTGTGKTAAFALPILHRLHTAPVDKTRRGPVRPRALILSPTRELAGQIEESFDTYGRHTMLRQAVIFGGVSQFHQVRRLKQGVDILVATPGRLIDLMEQGHVDLRKIEIFVLDEADRMLDMGFIHPIRRIAASVPSKRQTLLFSATMPASIKHLADALLQNPVRVTVKPAKATTALIEQSVYMVQHGSKPELLEQLLAGQGVDRALVFTRTKYGADKLTRRLNRSGVSADAIHGNKAQNQRQRALDAFRTGRSRVLVATDVAARGIDVDGVTHVFNFDLPNEPEAYVHRIGRTGRAGATGMAISFCDHSERGHLRAIERLTGKRLETIGSPSDDRRQPRDEEGGESKGKKRRRPAERQDRSSTSTEQSNKRRPRSARGRSGPRSARPGAKRGRGGAGRSRRQRAQSGGRGRR